MNLRPYIESLRHDLTASVAASDEQAQAAAERLIAALDAAVRLTLLNALSDAAAEITCELAPGWVELRLHGVEPSFAVVPAERVVESGPAVPDLPPVAVAAGEDGGTSRINLRLPDQLKLRVEESAAAEGLSVNAWLVRAAAAGLAALEATARPARRAPRTGNQYTGWVR